MAKKRFVVKEGYLAMGDRNIYRGSEVELEASAEGTKILLDMGAIEEMKALKKEKDNNANN
jgi:hypothetical protein